MGCASPAGVSGEKAALRSGVAEGQHRKEPPMLFFFAVERENSRLDDYGPQYFCVASDSAAYRPQGKKTVIFFQTWVILLSGSGSMQE